MNDVMLDLETMGTGPNAAIIAIGAAEFDIERQALGRPFYCAVALDSSVRRGGEIDPSTVLWWMRQSDAARAAFERPCLSFDRALKLFADFLSECAPISDVRIWGNGASFDNVILASAYRRNGTPQPWQFWNDRCYRTIKALHPDIPIERTGTHHNALDDAKSQAIHLMAMLGGKA